jgi:hypothetical protein
MSNSIFATKKIMNIIYGEEKRVSLIFPRRGPQNSIAQIECFEPEGGGEGSFGYSIVLPIRDSEIVDISIDPCCIAEVIGAFLLHYDTIKEKSTNLPCRISVDDNTFSMNDLREFSKHLSAARRKDLNNFSNKIGSRQRILNMK